MDAFANLILNNAQTIRDGGLISSILENVELLNNSQMQNDIIPFIKSPRMTGGYVAAIVFGVIWILALIAAMVYLYYLHFNKQNAKSHLNRIFKLKAFYKKGKLTSFNRVDLAQMLVIFVFLIPLLLLFCFCFMNVNQIYNSIDKPDNFQANSSEKVTSIIPSIKRSLFHLRFYLSTFADDARTNTAPVVEDIIKATKNMQNETMTSFNKKLMKRLGVESTFKYGREMTDIVVMFFDISNSLIGNQSLYNDVINTLYPRIIDPEFGLFKFISDIKRSFDSLPTCDAGCTELLNYFKQHFSEVESFPDISFANAFLFVMKKQNKTRESVIAQTEYGKKEMDKAMAETQEKMKRLLDIDGTIRNMTGETWTKMDEQFQTGLENIDNMTDMLDSKSFSDKKLFYSNLLVLGLVFPILFGIIILSLALGVLIHVFFYPSKSIHTALKHGIHSSLFLLSLMLLFSTLAFLYGGKFETELCRYLRTNQPFLNNDNPNELVLDKYINTFLNKTLSKVAEAMPKSEFPLPKPKNVLYGLIHRCRKNEAILQAIDAIDSLDTSALSKPEVAEKFIRVGRRLLLESLNETDPNKMLPPDMKESLDQASQLEMFKDIDINASIRNISRSLIFITTPSGKVSLGTKTFIDKIEKYLSAYAINIADPRIKIDLQNQFSKLLKLLEQYNIIIDKLVYIFTNMKSIPSIKPIVNNLRTSLNEMLETLNNKTALFRIGNEYFDKYIVASTPQNAAKIMATYGPKMMSKLGYCRPLFEAYRASIDTTCDILIPKFNVYWMYLGTVGFLLTYFLFITFFIMFRIPTNPEDKSPGIDLEKDVDHLSVEDPFVQKDNNNNINSIKHSGV